MKKNSFAYTSEFEAFWSIYPRRVAKRAAWKSWVRIIDIATPAEVVIDGAKRFAHWCRANGKEEQYIPHPTTWLNQGRWEDELGPIKNGGGEPRASFAAIAGRRSH